jgi:hypothetical protein
MSPADTIALITANKCCSRYFSPLAIKVASSTGTPSESTTKIFRRSGRLLNRCAAHSKASPSTFSLGRSGLEHCPEIPTPGRRPLVVCISVDDVEQLAKPARMPRLETPQPALSRSTAAPRYGRESKHFYFAAKVSEEVLSNVRRRSGQQHLLAAHRPRLIHEDGNHGVISFVISRAASNRLCSFQGMQLSFGLPSQEAALKSPPSFIKRSILNGR